MIDAERMLGSLVRNAMGGGRRRGRRRRRRSSMLSGATKGALGLGALGVAIAAFEHFSQQKSAAATAAAGVAPPAPSGSVPPPPPPPTPARSGPPPPPPGAALPPRPPGPPEARAGAQDEAMLLIRAMIAAANADYDVDAEERARILRGLDESGLGDEEKRFLLAELETPMDLATLAGKVTSPGLARQVYLASLMAIAVDTPAEANYLARLAGKLELDEAQVRELEEMLDGANETGP